jgi:hypothetical protein
MRDAAIRLSPEVLKLRAYFFFSACPLEPFDEISLSHHHH